MRERESNLDRMLVIVKDKSNLLFYFGYLEMNGIRLKGIRRLNGINECETVINKTLESEFKDEKTKFEFIDRMNRSYLHEAFNLNSFDWIYKDERACYFVWKTLRYASEDYLYNNKKPNRYIHVEYTRFRLNTVPTNHKERHELIIDFINRISLSYEDKLYLMDDLQSNWTEVFSSLINLKWLDRKNKEQCQWAWKYVVNNFPNILDIDPLSEDEMYLAINFTLDHLSFSYPPAERILFIQNLTKAWGQKKHRIKMGEKKPLNTYLESKVKNELLVISQLKDMKIQDVISSLITAEYTRLTKKKDV